MEAAQRIRKELLAAGIRVKLDEREGQSAGFKFNDWEMRGVPLRMELGPKGRGKGFGGSCATQPARQRRQDVRAAAGHRARGGADADRNSTSAFRSRRLPSAKPTRRSLSILRNSRRPLRKASRFHGGAVERTAKLRSRKPRRPQCAAFRSSSPAVQEPASSAASPPKRRPSSQRHTKSLSCPSLRPEWRAKRLQGPRAGPAFRVQPCPRDSSRPLVY